MLNRLPTPTQMPSLSVMIYDIGNPTPRQLAKALSVTERTVCRWIQLGRAPRSVELSLYWLTGWGQRAVHCEAHNSAVMHAGMARCLREQIEHMKAKLEHLGRIADFGAANDPADGVRAYRPTIGAPQLHRSTVAKPAKKRGSPDSSKTSATKQPRGLQRG